MQGLNIKFTAKPEEFLHHYVMGEVGMLSTNYRMRPDVYHFDLILSKKGVAELHKVDPEAHEGEELIKAYWLPWYPEQTKEIELGNDASYFFTSSLDGCRLQIVPASPDCKVKVLHIAGDKGGDEGAGQGGTDWREEQAKKKLGPEELQRSRAFSASKETPDGYKQYKDHTERHFVFVVGFITKPKAESEFLWELWAQPRQGQITENPILKEPWRIWPADAGRRQRDERCVIL